MNHIRNYVLFTIAAAILTPSAARADVRADEKTRVELAGMLGRMMNMFGGKAAREGVVSTVIVKGDRKVTLHEDNGQIIDLAEEKIYDLDLKKKSYKVTTFAELRRRWEEQQKRAQERTSREQRSANEKPAERDPNAKEMEVDFDVKNTGQKKTINGFDTHEVVMTITVREKGKTLEQSGGMVLTSDMWLAPTVRSMKEVADFDMRYAQKLYGGVAGLSAEQMAAALAMYPMIKPALARMSSEGGKLDGTAIETTTTMDAVKSAEQVAQESKDRESSASKSDDSDAKPQSGLGGLLGGLSKKIGPKGGGDDDAGKPRATFMTMTHEVLKIGSDVSAADLAIPAGFKEK
jgi:hypothetical protein